MKLDQISVSVLELTYIQLLALSAPWKSNPLGSDRDHHMIFVAVGKLLVHSESFEGVLNAGEMLVMAYGSSEFSLQPLTEPSSVYCLSFVSAQANRLQNNWTIEGSSPPYSGKIHVSPLPVVIHLLSELHRIWNRDRYNHIQLQIRWLELWELLMKAASERSANLNALLQGLVKHMDEHSNQSFQIEEMARYSGVTPTIFYQKFKEHTSLSPLQYVNKCRMEKARQLLVESEASIREVGESVGYKDHYYFNRMFKKIVGIPPFRYQTLLCRKIAVLHPALFGNLGALGVPSSNLIPIWNNQEQKSPYREVAAMSLDWSKLRHLEPDWIVGTDGDTTCYDQLSDIAPTRLITFKPGSWQMHFTELADMLQIKEVAERWLYYYQLKLATARERLQAQLGNETLMAVRIGQQGVRVYGAHRRKIGRFLYHDLQLHAPKGTFEFAFTDLVHVEEINDFNADHILLLHDHDSPIEKKLPIKGNIYYAHTYPWLHFSAIGHEQAVSDALIRFSR